MEIANHKLWLAPLSGYTDQAFRQLCKLWGADVAVSEMVSAEGIIRKMKRTMAYLEFAEEERPFGIQLFGSDADVLARAASIVSDYKPDFIDINMGCPVKKVINRNAGCALMKTPTTAFEIVRSVRHALNPEIPLTVKFRSGIDYISINYLEFGLGIQEAGADLITLHPRTLKQGFSGKSNWEHIKLLKSALSIPVVGNGDIATAQDAIDMFEQTNCDSIMIGRGVVGKPWLFAQIKHHLAFKTDMVISNEQIMDSMFKHIELSLKYLPEYRVVKEMRSHLCQYIRGKTHAASFRNSIVKSMSLDTMKNHIKDFFTSVDTNE